tara:strand:- start:4496 stop:4612 length:117 start_codon:yes stop_codon:yes gene_type:complete
MDGNDFWMEMIIRKIKDVEKRDYLLKIFELNKNNFNSE